jgi:SSS family solute:Na+ symporter
LAALNDITSAEDIHRRYGTFLARGPLKDLGGCLSLTLGVVCTQTYAQAIWSAATTRKARRGAVYCAALIPLIGAACTLVGMYMRGHYVTTAELAELQRVGESHPDGVGVLKNSLQAFPTFIIAHLPAWLGGIALGTLLINILGCGSGLVLGAATILTRDVYGNLFMVLKRTPRMGLLAQTRLSIVILLVLGIVAAHFVQGSFINDLGFLSLGLRAAALMLPLSFALWLPGCFKAKYVTASMIFGTMVMLAAGLLHLPADPMYYGLVASALVLLLGVQRKQK